MHSLNMTLPYRYPVVRRSSGFFRCPGASGNHLTAAIKFDVWVRNKLALELAASRQPVNQQVQRLGKNGEYSNYR